MPMMSSSLRVCRGCLSTDGRLHDMRQNRLMEAYTRLIQVTDDLPHYLCSYCAALLLKCDTFRIKCIDALLTLRNAQLDDGQLSMQHIKNIKKQSDSRFLYYQTQVQILNINEINEKDLNMENMNNDYEPRITREDSNASVSLNEDITDNGINDLGDDVTDDVSDESIKGTATEDDDPYVFDEGGNIKPHFVIHNKINNDHDYTVNYNVDTYISNVVQEYLKKNGNSDFLYNSKVNLYCNEATLMKINENKKMKLKIVDQVNSNVMNDKLLKMLHGKGNKSNNEEIRTVKKLYKTETVKELPDKESSKINITNDGKYITIGFEDASKEANADHEMDDAGFKCIPIGVKFDGRSNRGIKYSDKDIEKFAEEFNMNVTFFHTKDEQIISIENRQNTQSYKVSDFKCEKCFKAFVTVESFNKHMFLHSESQGSYVCDICNYHFKNKYQRNSHLIRHSYMFTCNLCPFTTSYLTVAKNHHMRHIGDKLACIHCGKEFKGPSSFYTHLKVAHPTSHELVRCEMCGDSFYGATGVRQHENLAHKDMRSPECHCSGCDTQFYCSDAFKAHQGTDGLCDTTYKYCVRCGMSFETEQLLKEHEIEQRKPRDEFECEVCKKKFSNYVYYKAHSVCHLPKRLRRRQLLQHRDRYRRPCMCELCGTVVMNRGLLTLHHRVKHSTERPYQCTYCEKAFKSSMPLKIHLLIHTGERPYKCTMCPKAFQSPGNLARHEFTHTGERAFNCPICGKSYKTMNCIKTHVKYVHMKVPVRPRIRCRKKIKKDAQ